jgi:hypothetical protein
MGLVPHTEGGVAVRDARPRRVGGVVLVLAVGMAAEERSWGHRRSSTVLGAAEEQHGARGGGGAARSRGAVGGASRPWAAEELRSRGGCGGASWGELRLNVGYTGGGGAAHDWAATG